MVMGPELFFEAVDEIRGRGARGEGRGKAPPSPAPRLLPHVILLSPQGERLTQAIVERLSKQPWVILLCGHYEGVDERVRIGLAHEELSIGDYVLTCGELPAMVLVDSVVRLLPGSLGDEQSAVCESFSGNLLEYPQFTRPSEYRGMRVPEVLLSGDSSRVEEWRKLQALRRTSSKRPDLIHPTT